MLKALLLAAVLLPLGRLVAPDPSQIVQLPPSKIPTPPTAPEAPAPQAFRSTSPPATDIYELSLDGRIESLKNATPVALATQRGYDNQPFYTPDGAAILFTGNRDGKQTDIFEFDRKSRRVRHLISTPESEYSPAITPDGKGVSVIRVEGDGTQRLWRLDRNGTAPRVVLAEIKPVGYHAWIDDDQLALFVLGTPATLQHARLASGTARVVAQNIGRSLHRIPQTRAVSFVHREAPDDVWVKQFDPATGGITPLVRIVAGNDEGDVAWTPDGTLLMSSASKIFAWRRGEDGWREVYNIAAHALGAITRMAVAPDGRALAMVINEPAR